MHRMWFCFYGSFIAGFIVISANASVNPIQEQSVFDEIPSGFLQTVFQGKNTLWLGGENGLFALTGTHVKHFNSTNSELVNSEILDVFEDNRGLVWLGTAGGVSIFTPLTQTFHNISELDEVSLRNCLNLAHSELGKMLVNCSGEIISINMSTWDVDNWREDNIPHLSSAEIGARIAFDSEQNIWLSHKRNGLFQFNPETQSTHHYHSGNANLLGTFPISIFVDLENDLWVGTELGLNKFDRINNHFIQYPLIKNSAATKTNNSVSKMIEESSGNFWVASSQLFIFDKKTEQVQAPNAFYPYLYDTSDQYVVDMDETTDGDLLLVGSVSGLRVLPVLKDAITYIAPQVTENFALVATLLLDDDNFLFAGSNSHLYLYSLSTKQAVLKLRNIGYVTDIAFLDESKLLIATEDKGLFSLDVNTYQLTEQTKVWLDFPADVYSIKSALVVNNSTIYLGTRGDTNRGLYMGNLHDGFVLQGGNLNVNKIDLDKKGNVIVSTSNDGVHQLEKDGTWFKWKSEHHIENMIWLTTRKDNDGVFWVSTNGKGLGYLDTESHSIKFIDTAVTADSLFIRDTLQDSEGYHWIMTNKGLVRYDKQNSTSIKLGKEDGIVDLDFEPGSSISLPGGKILIVGDRARYIIDTKLANIYLNKRLQRQTEALLVELQVSDEENRANADRSPILFSTLKDNDSALQLDYNEYLFTLTFAANNYVERHVLSFEYRLLGLDDSWKKVSSKNNSATYSTLPSGNYEFQVRVVDPKSVAEQAITRLKISVLPPPWLSWWAYLLYAIAVLLALYFTYSYRTRQLRLHNIALEKAVSERTSDLQRQTTTLHERTSELQNKTIDLNNSNQHINHLLEQKQSLFANVSHEFRTPLALIIGPLEKILSKINDLGLQKQVGLINRNAMRLARLVDQILELAKLETARNIPLKKYPIQGSIKMITGSFEPLMQLRSQQLELQLNCSGSLSLQDDSLEKILSNLLSNAIKYTPFGGRITVTASQAKNSMILNVTDNGPGINEDMQSKIFERFLRLEGTEDISGSGLGLALVKEIVEANSGTIEVHSRPSEGSRFTVTLPMTAGDERKLPQPTQFQQRLQDEVIVEQQETDPITTVNESRSMESLLVVEDNPDMRAFIVDSLQHQYHCLTANNGVEGIERAIETVPDLIISDVMMPGKTGFELVETLREHDLTSHIPIVLLTAKGDESSRMTGWRMNVDDYIAKPFNMNELQARVARLLSIRKILQRKQGRIASEQIENPPTSSFQQQFESAKDNIFFQKFVAVIEKNYQEETFNRKSAASKLAISARQLNRKLTALIDFNFSEYLRKFRLEKAKTLLTTGQQVAQVCYQVGFSSPSYFSNCFKAEFDVTPKQFTENNTRN
ncbi:MAG: signal transduction histidine kinase/DNA-binding response OmpR family regulator [Paraglaciecola sp.]|jgi:signal transduction histidine kinase/DNA-binding response OmpR family regulator/ligand-binding sensor domain-containing protein